MSRLSGTRERVSRWAFAVATAFLFISLAQFGLAVIGIDWAFRSSLAGIGSIAVVAGLLFGVALVLRPLRWRRSVWCCVGLAVAAFWVVVFPPRYVLWIGDRSTSARFQFPVSEKVVALSIDDGLDRETTPAILDVLERHKACATFFVLGDTLTDSTAEIANAIAANHELANHQMADQPGWKMSPSDFEQDVSEAGAVIREYQQPTWFRPGGGFFTPEMSQAVAQQNLCPALGSVYPWDSHQSSTEFTSDYILGRVFPGAIIVLHDGGDRGRRTAAVLDKVLPHLVAKGYRVATLSEVAEIANQR